jgi:hypothetical protein
VERRAGPSTRGVAFGVSTQPRYDRVGNGHLLSW